MKFLLVCLGNPGQEYVNTRHNIGFKIADALAKRENIDFSSDRLALRAEFNFRGKKIILLKPLTYMNLSGKALLFHMLIEKIPPERILVITDDLSIPFGKLRLKSKGSAGGHNGLKNISELLGNDLYPRLRVGIGSDFPAGKQVDYVLADFKSEEQAGLPLIYDLALKGIDMFIHQGIDHTMTWLNGRNALDM